LSTTELIYRCVVLKVSGEGFAGSGGFGISPEPLAHMTNEIRQVHNAGIQVAVVVGGGNFIRGGTFAPQCGIAEATAHHMGMLATVINGLALQESLEQTGVPTHVLSAFAVASVCEPYARRRCIRHLEKGRVTILVGGTGRPFVTTDTAAAVAAAEIGADAILKATQVDGVYSADPKSDPSAKFYPNLSFDKVMDERLGVMDLSAIDLCRRNNIPIVVFDLHKSGNMARIIAGESIGTVISKSKQ